MLLPKRSTEEQDQPCRLQIWVTWDSTQQHPRGLLPRHERTTARCLGDPTVCRGFSFPAQPREVRHPHAKPERLKSLTCAAASGVSIPTWLETSPGSTPGFPHGESVSWRDSTAQKRRCGACPQRALLGKRHANRPRKRRDAPLTTDGGRQTPKHRVWLNECNAGMRGSPCSPPSSQKKLWVVPSASSHKYEEGPPWNCRTKGNTEPAPCNPLVIEARDTWSNAPTPSTDNTVENGSMSVIACNT